MIDFSTPEEIGFWLAEIRPDERCREVAVALAARAALRVLPLVKRTSNGKPREGERLSRFALLVFRAVAIPCAASWQPARAAELISAARAAVGATMSATQDQSVNASCASANAATTLDPTLAVNASTPAINAARLAARLAGELNAFDRALNEDAASIDTGRSGIDLIRQPLWQSERLNSPANRWLELKDALLQFNQEWEVWTDWYEARLAGDAADPPNEALEVARATIPEEIWRQGPAVVNAEIKRLIDLYTPKNTVVSVAAFGVETLTSVGEVTPSTAVPLQGAEAGASAGEVVPNSAPSPAGWMNTGDDPAVQLAARTRLQARAALEAASVTQPPFPLSQVPTAGTAPQPFGGTTAPPNPPPIPATELGPTLEVNESGLTLAAPQPLGEFDPAVQLALQERLKRICPELFEATRRVGNLHPGLMAVVSEYASLIAQPLANLDVTSLWVVGAGLLANREAFARLPQAGGMTEPLEPAHLALLQQVAEIHGAFILGFGRGRELTERADHSRLTPETLATILPAARDLLEFWRRARTMVEERTRKFFDAVADAAIGQSWQTARVGYSIYVVTRNSLIAAGKLLLRANSALSTIAGSILLSEVDPGLVQTQLWLQFMLDQSQTILSFSEPFPELKIWLASLIDALESDKAFREK